MFRRRKALLEGSALSETGEEGSSAGGTSKSKGFSGLASLVSDPFSPGQLPSSEHAVLPNGAEPPSSGARSTNSSSNTAAFGQPAKERRVVTGKLIVWLLASVLGFVWVASALTRDPTKDNNRGGDEESSALQLQDTGASPGSAGGFAFQSVYTGFVTNAGLPQSPASFTLEFDSITDKTTGRATIGEPLSGSGPFTAIIQSDSVYLLTISAAGDTIFWKATRRRDQLLGDYELVGGPMLGQHGTWEVHLSGGRN